MDRMRKMGRVPLDAVSQTGRPESVLAVVATAAARVPAATASASATVVLAGLAGGLLTLGLAAGGGRHERGEV